MADKTQAEVTLKKIEQLASYSLDLGESTGNLIFNKLITTKLELVRLELEKVVLDAFIPYFTEQSNSINEIARNNNCTPKEAQTKIEEALYELNKLINKNHV